MTLLFWVLVAVMTSVATGFVLLPLLRASRGDAVRRRDVNVALYRERMRELDRAPEQAGLGPEEALAARAEAERRLLEDEAGPAERQPTHGQSSRWALALSMAIPVIAVAFYLGNSDWRLALTPDGPEAVQLLLGRLEKHLAKNPGDAAGWQLLAQSRIRMGDHAGAADAFARAHALAPSADALVGQAEALALAGGGLMQGRPALLIEEAMRTEPRHPRALWYAGLAASQRGDNGAALKHWNKLAAQSLPPQFRVLLNAAIAQAGGSPAPEAAPLHLSVDVSLDRSLPDVPADTPVFIYARAAGETSGPPLAVVRRRVADLPLHLTLSDADSMLPTRKLSSAEGWRISARVALQGSAEARSGDYIATADISEALRTQPVKLRIKARVP